MSKVFSQDWQAKFALLLFVLFTGWWVFLQFNSSPRVTDHNFFSDSYGIVALFGGICGLLISRRWGGFKSVMGKAIIFLSLGLLAQEFGQLAYSYYYLIKNIEVPYPSVGDIGYFASIPFYIYGVKYLAKASGVKLSSSSLHNKVITIVIPSLILTASYFIFLKDYQVNLSNPITTFLDFGYPLGEAIYLSLALLTYILSRAVLGGTMRYRILIILIALLLQYMADFTFLYQANNETWVAGGINDYMYLISYFVMTLGLLELNTHTVKKSLD